MLSITLGETQFHRGIKVPTHGKTKTLRNVPLEGVPQITIESGAEFFTLAPEPSDPSGLTLRVTSIVNENSVGEGPWLGTAKVTRDGRVGEGEVEVAMVLAVQINAGDAVSADMTAEGAPEDQGTPPNPNPNPTARR